MSPALRGDGLFITVSECPFEEFCVSAFSPLLPAAIAKTHAVDTPAINMLFLAHPIYINEDGLNKRQFKMNTNKD